MLNERLELYKFPKSMRSRYKSFGINLGLYDNVKFVELELGRYKWRLKYVLKSKFELDLGDDE